MSEVLNGSYWCHMCSQFVSPIIEVEIKCPYCHSGFVEEMNHSGRRQGNFRTTPTRSTATAPTPSIEGGDHALIILLVRANAALLRNQDGPSRDRVRNMLAGLGINDTEALGINDAAGVNDEDSRSTRSDDGERGGLPGGVILTQTIVVQGRDRYEQRSSNEGNGIGISPGDYFVGPLDQFLQQLAENDGGSYGTPPAQKKAVEAMPLVTADAEISCSICLEDMVIGSKAREMPCKHRFHSDCILPWLKLHSSCPVCRFCMPAEESKGSEVTSNGSNEGRENEGIGGNWRRLWVRIPWFFSNITGSSSGGSEDFSAAPQGSE